jgi:hypothetical protein
MKNKITKSQIFLLLVNPILKFCKGTVAIIAIYTVLAMSVFILDSCKKVENSVDNSDKAGKNFIIKLKNYRRHIGSVGFTRGIGLNIVMQNDIRIGTSIRDKVSVVNNEPSNPVAPVYLDFPKGATSENINLVNKVTSIQQLADLQNATNAVIQYSPTTENSNNELRINIATLNNSLSPMILEAKQYLYAKGLSDFDIQNMLLEHKGKDEDLVPFVIALANAEVQPEPEMISRNYLQPFFSTANAKLNANDYQMCAIVAIGADVLFSLATSGLKTWSRALIMKAFGTVAKRMLGPVGVAIAVVSFGVCLAERND